MATIAITDFTGRLTRNNIGSVNSGMAKFDTSFGYNPFFKPGQLTWGKYPGDVTGSLNGLVVAGVSRMESGVLQKYVITNTAHLVKITGDGGGQTPLAILSSGSPTFNYGGDIIFYGTTNQLYIAHDKGVTLINSDGSGETQVGTWDATNFTPITTRRCLMVFNGLLYASNSDPSVTYSNNIAEISSGGLVNTYAKLSPSLPTGTYIRDLDITNDLTYMLISASFIPSEILTPVNDQVNEGSSSSALYKWNGIDLDITNGVTLPNFGVTALQTFGSSQMMFMYDVFGAALYDGSKKNLTMRNNKCPMPPATCTAGNFITWMSPDFYFNKDTQGGTIYGSLYYYGSLDENGPVGLWRMLRQQSAIGGVIYQIPFNQFTTNRYISVNTSGVVQTDSNGVHLYSLIDYSGNAGATNYKLYVFESVPPDDSPGGWSTPIPGVYETQTQYFGQKIAVKQIRVYCEPTVFDNGFQIDLIGGDGKILVDGTFNYDFVNGTDITQQEGSLDRINWDPTAPPVYAVGIRISNTGVTNMCINKIEMDYLPAGK